MNQPTSIHGGSFELQGISGASLVSGGIAMGIRLGHPHPSLGLFDGKDILFSLDRTPEQAPDLSYARAGWRVPLTPAAVKQFGGRPRFSVNAPLVFDYQPGEAALVELEYALSNGVICGRYTSDRPVAVALIVNGCFRPAVIAETRPDGCMLTQDGIQLQVRFNRPLGEPRLADTRLQLEQAWFGTVTAPFPGRAMAAYFVTLTPEEPLYFQMFLGAFAPGTAVMPAEIANRLAAGKKAYAAQRMTSSGCWKGAAAAVADLAAYSRTWDPKQQRLQTTVNRTWGGPNSPGLIFGWDNFFTSYIAAWENPELGAASLEHIVTVYGANGIENGPTQRNLIIPILYCRTLELLGDDALARRTWPTMLQFMRFWFADRGDGLPWRDGNRDGLIESGSCMDPATVLPATVYQNAMDETGYDEIPIYSNGFADERRGMLADGVGFDWNSRCLTVSLVCQNSLYIAAGRIMARLADRLGFTADAAWLRSEADRVARRMQEQLFCEKDGIFRDRRWDGTFSPVKAMTLFYPLLAGIADDRTKAKLKAILLDPKQFWGRNLIPTVSRDDPAYCDGLDRRGNYWRGNIWAPTNYIVYLAIKEAGWDDVAYEFGKRCYQQFMEYWRKHGHAYENYPPEGKVDHEFLYVQCWGGREIRYTWAGMMLFCGLEEVFGLEVLRPGFRFGNPHLPRQSGWHRFRLGGRRVSADAGPRRTRVQVDGSWKFLAEPGIAVRGFHESNHAVRFTAEAPAPARIRLAVEHPLTGTVTIDGQPAAGVTTGRDVQFELPAGRHEVEIR